MLSLITLSLIAAMNNAPVAQSPIPCLAAPSGSSKTVQECFNDACDDYQAAYDACDDQNCRSEAWVQHIIATGKCLPTLLVSTDIESDPWITIWFTPTQSGFSFNGEVPQSTIARFAF